MDGSCCEWRKSKLNVKFVKLVVKQESDICNAAHYRLSEVKEKGFFLLLFCCVTVSVLGADIWGRER